MAKPSKVSRFRRGSRSVKTTIPIEVAELLKLKPGDTIIWEVKLTNGERVALVKRMAP